MNKIPIAEVLNVLDECKVYSSNRVKKVFEKIKFAFFKLSVSIVLSMMNEILNNNETSINRKNKQQNEQQRTT